MMLKYDLLYACKKVLYDLWRTGRAYTVSNTNLSESSCVLIKTRGTAYDRLPKAAYVTTKIMK